MYQGITCVYNPPFTMLNLFETMRELGMNDEYAASKKLLRERAPELLMRTAKKVATFAEPDGSFSYCVGHPAPVSQGMKVCIPNLPESDVNANALAQGARTMTLEAIGIKSVPIFDENDAKMFFEICGEK